MNRKDKSFGLKCVLKKNRVNLIRNLKHEIMKKLAFFLSVVMLLSVSCNNSSKTKTNKTKKNVHKAFVSDKYGFEVDFPGTPDQSKDTYEVNGEKLPMIVFGYGQDDNSYLTVMVFEVPENFKQQSNPLETIKKQVLMSAQNIGLEEVSLKENTYDGLPSVLYIGSTEERHGIIEGIATDKYLYLVAALAEGPNAQEFVNGQGKKFVDSFKLLK